MRRPQNREPARRRLSFADFAKTEYGITCTPASYGGGAAKGRPGAGTPADGGMDKNTELQSTSDRIAHARGSIKNGGAQ